MLLAESLSKSPFILHRLLVVTDSLISCTQNPWILSEECGEKIVIAQEANAPLRMAGIFDIFPESYWTQFTTLKQVQLRCRIRGRATLRLIRRQAEDSSEICLVEKFCDGGDKDVILSADLQAHTFGHESYLLLEMIAAEPDATLVRAGWEALQVPDRHPRLGVVITTYNRESFLIANLARLKERLAGGCIIVVNHGAPDLAERLSSQLLPDPHIHWIEQENSGGAGGFTRGMLEHHAAGDVTHILLMDDDIDLPTDIVERMTAIFAFTHPELCLGGAMFDYHQRAKLFSAGDVLLPGSFGIGHIIPSEGCDISQPDGVDFLARIHRPDFNGWWCFAFPTQALDSVGLPMPCFIRGDDVEFGYRLMRAGFPTLGWPGLAVWHMPFADKSAPWHMFYDRRNGLFANALHRRVGRWPAMRKLFGGFRHHLLRYDYDRVRAMTMGIAAFNRGPAALANWSHHDHAALIVSTKPADLEGSMRGSTEQAAILSDTRRLTGVVKSLRLMGRLCRDLTGMKTRHASRCFHTPPGELWRPDFKHRPDRAVEFDANGKPVRTYVRNSGEARRATVLFLRALVSMAIHFHQSPHCTMPYQVKLKGNRRHSTKRSEPSEDPAFR